SAGGAVSVFLTSTLTSASASSGSDLSTVGSGAAPNGCSHGFTRGGSVRGALSLNGVARNGMISAEGIDSKRGGDTGSGGKPQSARIALTRSSAPGLVRGPSISSQNDSSATIDSTHSPGFAGFAPSPGRRSRMGEYERLKMTSRPSAHVHLPYG